MSIKGKEIEEVEEAKEVEEGEAVEETALRRSREASGRGAPPSHFLLTV